MNVPEPIKTTITDETFAGVTYHIRGVLVPELQVELQGQDIMFEHHTLLWKESATKIELRALKGGIKRKIAGLDFFVTKAIAPGRGDALKGVETGRDAIAMTRDFVTTLYGAAESAVAKGRNLKEAMAMSREVMDPKFSKFAIYEHCLPFNVSRAFDEASGIDDPVIWTDKRDQEMWANLQGGG